MRILGAPVLITGLSGLASAVSTSRIGNAQTLTGQAPPPQFKPIGIDRSKVLKIYSGRDRPDLTPVYKMWEQLTGMRIDLIKMSHFDVMPRIVAERHDPQADLMVTNTMVEPEIVHGSGVFDPYANAERAAETRLR